MTIADVLHEARLQSPHRQIGPLASMWTRSCESPSPSTVPRRVSKPLKARPLPEKHVRGL
jgi:hypothetical protein